MEVVLKEEAGAWSHPHSRQALGHAHFRDRELILGELELLRHGRAFLLGILQSFQLLRIGCVLLLGLRQPLARARIARSLFFLKATSVWPHEGVTPRWQEIPISPLVVEMNHLPARRLDC